MKTLLVFKKTLHELYQDRHKHFYRKLAKDREFCSCLARTHTIYKKSLALVEHALRKRHIPYEKVYRKDLAKTQADLVICVGGDGTFIEAAHRVDATLLLVNANPKDSQAFYSCCTAGAFGKILDQYLSGKLHVTLIPRLKLVKDNKIIAEHPMNDILFAHEHPARITRYDLTVRGKTEEHKSSGIWIAPPGGTTAAIRSAGGKVLPITARKFEFVVREPYMHTGMTSGILNAGESLTITSKTRRGRIYVDGDHVSHGLGLLETLTITLDKTRVRVVGFDAKKQKRY